MRLPRFAGGDIAVDLGTANTVVFVRGQGVVVFEPSVIALDDQTGEVLAVGADAKRMIGRTPSAIRATRPLRHGVIADFSVTEQMLGHFIARSGGRRFARPRVMLCVPSGVTGVERRAVEEATIAAGARSAYLIEEPMAAAIGAGLPVDEPAASMVVDIGGGTTEVAVISLGGMVVKRSLRVGGYEMDEAIIRDVRVRHNLSIGQETAERAKIALGSALGGEGAPALEVRGRDGLAGLLRAVELSGPEVAAAIRQPVRRIVDAIKSTLEETPPELAADLVQCGIVLAGGGSLLRGFAERLEADTQLPVRHAEDPLTCVAIGAGRSLEELDRRHAAERLPSVPRGW